MRSPRLHRFDVTTIVLALVLVLWAGIASPAAEPMRLPVDPARLEVVATDGTIRGRFDLEIARTGDEHMRGLMHRTDLPADRAMLFVFEAAGQRAFWMKDTPLPLDIVFADQSGAIVRIARHTVPFSTVPVRSGAPALYVLEIHAGTAGALGMRAGDRLVHPAIGSGG
ncbi:MAG: DUF192 domain-containing protein [Roseitalea sp.]|jgi:uncharacterized membrane protein (UPF0127 family)|nr:DUF192 domain-containing protein [Roseitalea sp.]MBO6723740.1 DUF192 domain-containing protein [Roseitalea sp.]MBO6744664.1 DUF192 domain-containing protein [Roseitalea sp.]